MTVKKHHFARVALAVAVVCATVGAAYILAAGARSLLDRRHQAEVMEVRRAQTEAALELMPELSIGDTIEPLPVEDLTRQPVDLQKLARERFVLIIINPNCESCVEELNLLQSLFSNPDDLAHFVVVSAGNPYDLQDLVEQYQVRLPIYYDHRARFLSQLRVSSFPFNIILDRNWVVHDLFTGSLTPEEARHIALSD